MKQSTFCIPSSKNAGIYMLWNINNNKVYIGQTTSFNKRALQHITNLSKNRHHNKKLQRDFNKGMEFRFVIIEEVNENCKEDNLRVLEMKYIYFFYDLGLKLYNSENKNEVKELLFQHMMRGTMERISGTLGIVAEESKFIDDIKILALKRNISLSELARRIEEKTLNNNSMFKRNSIKDADLKEYANALGCDVKVIYRDRETGKVFYESKL